MTPVERKRYAKGLGIGLAFVAAAVFVSWAAAADTSPVSWIAPYAFLAAVFWWIAVVLGAAAAASAANRLSAGLVVGVLAVPAYVLSVALTRAPGGWGAVFGQGRYWLIAVLTVTVPCLIGVGFGWSVVHHRPEYEHRHGS